MKLFPFLAALGATTFLAPLAHAIPDKGDFKVVWSKPKKRDYVELQKELRESRALEEIAQTLNATFNLPRDIKIGFEQLGEPNAYYDPNTSKISLGYELLEDLDDVLKKSIKNEDKRLDAALNATLFIFFHELGHALIDVYDLPVVGKEEDAVDQLSVVILNDDTSEGAQMALDGARAFLQWARRDENSMQDLAMWGEHSLSEQRFYNIIALVYGSNSEKFAYLVKNKTLPKERAESAPEEWERVESAWLRLLAPYVKD